MNLSELFIRRPVADRAAQPGHRAGRGDRVLLEDSGGGAAELQHAGHQRCGAAAGRRPETMATSVALQLEKQFSTIPGLDIISSTSTLGSTSLMTLEFAAGGAAARAASRCRRT